MPSPTFASFLVSYRSDGLRLYARVDLPPGATPDAGHPVVVFAHGWRGIELAPSLAFYYAPESYYYDMINAYREAGFAVITPGYRGHGTVNGVPADGLEDMAIWDQGSFLSPVLYAIDVMNLLDGLATFDAGALDLGNVNLVGHSQGGDVVLLVAAAAGGNAGLKQPVRAVSVWNGLVAPRMAQLNDYALLQQSAAGFTAGDGTWTGSADGTNGQNNPNFVFGWPPEWIETPHPADWTWQRDTWSRSVSESLNEAASKLYATLRQQLPSLRNAHYRLAVSPVGRVDIEHDPRVSEGMRRTHAIDNPALIDVPLNLHFSDRDFYSPPEWNRRLCATIAGAGGRCKPYEYAGNTHRLRLSERPWFSSPEHRAGFDAAVRRDAALFLRGD